MHAFKGLWVVLLILLYADAFAASEETPSIFTESNCMGSVKLPGKKPSPMTPIMGEVDFNIPVLCLPPSGANLIPANSQAQLNQALSNAQPGQIIMVGRGTYSGININKSGTASAPITVRAADPGQVRVTGGSNIGGNYVVVEGFIFDDASVVVSGDYSRFTRNVVINMSRNQGMTVIITGSFNRVDHNELANIAGRGISIKHDQGKGAGMRSNRIDYNYLHDWVGPPGQNTHEGIQVGTHNAEDHDIMRGHIVEYNLLENVNIENETICIKSSGWDPLESTCRHASLSIL